MNNYFRSDGWVKTTLGPAIPGAQVFVCTQPANINSAPPSPLANIYADNAGLVPIAQPMLTDGFGHYDFYAEAGVYTLVIAYAGTIQEVYPDQSVGAVGSGGGGALTLEANGEALPNQVLLNFYSSDATVTFTADEDGDGGLNLQVKGGTAFSGAGAGQFAGPGITLAPMAQNLSGVQLPGDGTTYVYKFVLDSAWTLTSCTFVWTNNLNGTISFALYTSSGAKISNTDNFMATDSGTNPAYTPVQNTFSATVLPAGVYYFAYASSGGSGLVVPGCALPFTSNSGTAFLGMVNTPGVFIGTAANSRTGNVMPSTLGAITGASTGIIMPTPIWAT